MAINGIAGITYGVDDIEACVRFYNDFGLRLEHRDEHGADFAVPEGSRVRIRHMADPTLPPAYSQEPGVREVMWGVESPQDIATLEAGLRADREVTRDEAGALHFFDDLGLAIGLKHFARAPLAPAKDAVNAPGSADRRNRPRAWYQRAAPQSIQHVVFGVPDIERGMRFYCERLRFRITDISRERGIFARCEGRNDHHNLFFLQADRLKWLHISFDVQNIDELMAGANHMQRRGWKSALGVGRHRISSSIFYYIESPCGGESEYSADTDFVDDNWKPGVWEPRFGNIHWIGALPAFLAEEPQENFRILDRPATVEDFRAPER